MDFPPEHYFQSATQRMRQAHYLYREDASFALAVYAGRVATDIVYGVRNNRQRGGGWLLHCECGATYLAIPLWLIGLPFAAALGHWLFFAR